MTTTSCLLCRGPTKPGDYQATLGESFGFVCAGCMPGPEAVRVCTCGATPCGSESVGTGDYLNDDRTWSWICLTCWMVENGLLLPS